MLVCVENYLLIIQHEWLNVICNQLHLQIIVIIHRWVHSENKILVFFQVWWNLTVPTISFRFEFKQLDIEELHICNIFNKIMKIKYKKYEFYFLYEIETMQYVNKKYFFWNKTMW